MMRILMLFAASIAGCSSMPSPQVVATEAEIACAMANAILGDATIRKICSIAEDEWVIIAPYLTEHRKAMLRMKVNKCGAP